MRRGVALLTAGCLLAAAGCGSSSSKTTSARTNPPPAAAPAATTTTAAPATTGAPTTTTTTATTTTALPVGLTSAQLEPELLTVSDLPTGWSSTPPVPDDSSNFCGVKTAARAGESGRAEADFQDGQLPIFNETVAAFPNAPKPQFDRVVTLLDKCRTINDDGTKLTLRKLSFPKLTPDSEAYQFTGLIKGLELELDLIVALKGKQVLLGGYGGIGPPDTAQLISFMRQAVAKVP